MSFLAYRFISRSGKAALAGTLFLSILLATPAYSAKGREESTRLNNEGVTALKSNDFETAIQKFKDALNTTNGYSLAKENMAIAYNNYGIKESEKPEKCLKLFHMAAWLQPENKTTVENIDQTVKKLGKDPKSFVDRIVLADKAQTEGDFAGAIVEYKAALSLRDDADAKKKLALVTIPDDWKKWLSDENKKEDGKSANADIDFGPYMADLQKRIKRSWFPPRGNETKKVVTMFKVHSDGLISDIKLDKSSGMAAADEAALDAVRNASPFRPLPKGAPDVVDIQFTFDYNVFANGKDKRDRENELKQKIGRDKSNGSIKEAAETEFELAGYYAENEKDSQAITQYRDALDLLENKVDDKALEAKVASGLADVYYGKSDYSSAKPLYERCLNIELENGKDKRAIATTQRDLGYTILYLDEDHTKDVMSLLNEALKNAEEVQKKDDDNDIQELIVDIKYGIGHAYWQNGQYDLAADQYKKVVEETRKLDGDENTDRVMLRQKDVADCYYEQKKLKESLDEYKKVLAISSKIDDADQDALKETLGRIDELSHRLGIPTEDDLALQNETKKAVDRSYSWLPYALGGALFALLIIYLASARQNNDVDIVGKKTDKNR